MGECNGKGLEAKIRGINVQVKFPPSPINYRKYVISQGFYDMQIYNVQKHMTTKKQTINNEINRGLKTIKKVNKKYVNFRFF